MRRILVPTDLSPLSMAALHVAVRIAKRMHAEVVVLKVVPVHGGAAFDDRGELVQDNADDITPFLAQRDADSKALAAHCAELDLPVTQLVRFGPLADTILRTVDQYAIDLLVMGTKGGSTLRDRLVGRLVEHLIGRADIPILSVKDDLHDNPLRRVLFTNAFRRHPQYFDVLHDLHDRAGCTVDLLRVNTPNDRLQDEEVKARMEAFARDNRLTRHAVHVVEAPSVEEGVYRWIADHDTDLLAIRTLGRSGFVRLIKGCVSLDLVDKLTLPILTIRVK